MKTHLVFPLIAAAFGLISHPLAAQDATPPPAATTAPFPVILPMATPTSPSVPAVATAPSPGPTAAPSAKPFVPTSPQAESWLRKALSVSPTQVVEEGESVPSLSVIRGPVVVKGTVRGNVTVVEGDVYVIGDVHGALSCVTGNVYILGRVDGSVSIISGNIYKAGTIGGHAKSVSGKVISAGHGTDSIPVSTSYSYVYNGEKHSFLALLSSAVAFVLRLSFALMWVALALLVATIFPATIERGGAFLSRELPRSFAIGLLWKLAYWMLLVVFLVASFLLVGLPFLAILILAQWVFVLVGVPILFLGLGRWLLARAGHAGPSFHLAILIGGMALGLVRLIPLVGDFVWWAAAVLASGLAIRQLLTLRVQSVPNAPAPSATPPPPAA